MPNELSIIVVGVTTMTLEQEKLLALHTRADAHYQSLLRQCGELESEYRRIMALLKPDDALALERYISLCEELEYRRTDIAMTIKMDSFG